MKKLIVGLGNMGEEYENTRHNIGFSMLNHLAKDLNTNFKIDRYGLVSMCNLKNQKLILLKPSTFMNLSGQAVLYWANKEKIALEDILILVDDLALPFGAIRLRGKGSDAGHNGLKNISMLLKSELYPRIRFGIGNHFTKGHQINFVLGKFKDTEEKKIPELLDHTTKMIKSFCLEGINTAMNNYNLK